MCQHLEWENGSDGYIKIEDRGLIDNKFADIYMYIEEKDYRDFLESYSRK